jgi:hypothetical protein
VSSSVLRLASVNSTASEPAWDSPVKLLHKKKKPQTALFIEPGSYESAGSLLLLAAANETRLISHFVSALPTDAVAARRPLTGSSQAVRERLLLTLLFLGAASLHRTWDLRSYTADGLALLSGRKRAYGYRYTEAFLSQIAHAGGAESLTDARARWTKLLWDTSEEAETRPRERVYYIDGHRKTVYSEDLIPRGLVGRLGTILGCRALVLLHDEQGHPRLVTTDRGDLHLTKGLPEIIARYERDEQKPTLVKRIIVDREGMATEFLASLHTEGRIVVTILRTNQYQDLTSFSEVGTFVPLSTDKEGRTVREVAPAQIRLPRPDHRGEVLCLQVALIRDLRRQVAVGPDHAEQPPRWDVDLPRNEPAWWEEGWQATAAQALETTAKLIPIVTTAPTINAVELAETYIHRWSAQENVIKDYLLPLGLDVNHGFAKVEVENSEATKQRTELESRLIRLKQRAQSASKREAQASLRYDRLCQEHEKRAEERYQELALYQNALELQGLAYPVLYQKIKEREAAISAELEPIRVKEEKAYKQCNDEFCKQERYCKQQREVLRALEDLKTKSRKMYELDNRKDQVMTVCKVAVANLAMWVRDQYFPTSYAHATWHRLLPFFQLPGTITCNATTIQVELSPFNDRALNRDLAQLCERVNKASPHLPDGRSLSFTVRGARCILPAQNVPRIA